MFTKVLFFQNNSKKMWNNSNVFCIFAMLRYFCVHSYFLYAWLNIILQKKEKRKRHIEC